MKNFFQIIITLKGVDFSMFFNRTRPSFIKGIAIGMAAGIAVGATAVIVCDEDRMRCIKKCAKNSWRSVTKKL